MDAGQPLFPSREELTQRVLGFLESRRLPPDSFLMRKHPRPGIEKGLITIEPNGARANIASGKWSFERPHMVLSILHLLGVPLLNPSEVIAWVKAHQSAAGFFTSEMLGANVREATHAACTILHWLGADRDEDGWDRPRLVQALRAQQRQQLPEGHFAPLPGDSRIGASESRTAFYCIASLAALGELPPYPEAAIAYIQGKQEAHGAFSQGWYGPARDWPDDVATFDALRCLALLSSRPLDPQACVAQIQSWQYADGGFYGYPADDQARTGHSSAYGTVTAVAALALLGSQPRDVEGCRRRVMELWVPEQGGFTAGPVSNPRTGAEEKPTYWALLTMATLGMLGPAKPEWDELLVLGRG